MTASKLNKKIVVINITVPWFINGFISGVEIIQIK